MSTAAICGRSKSGDRFYSPPGRRQLHFQKHFLLHDNSKHQPKFDDNHQQRGEFDRRRSEKQRFFPRDCLPASVGFTAARVKAVELPATNFDRFVEFTTPKVKAKYFSKTTLKELKAQEDEFRPYFVLGDLWESFKEWSAYGAGVPLLLNEGDSVKQYYVPFLSGIQLYIDPSKSTPGMRRPEKESDKSFRESRSNGSSVYETERGLNSFGAWREQDLAESNLMGLKGLSLRVKPLNGLSSDDGESSSSPSVRVFEYFEQDSPYTREPLADKISLLASEFPELNTYRSYELASSSWISVAWYPIYRIPAGPTLENFDACFLTYHSLSTSMSGGQTDWQPHFGSCPSYLPNGFDLPANLPLPIFGMSFYKFRISSWIQNGAGESPKVNSLKQAADEWLRHLNVYHPDHNFFALNSRKYEYKSY